MTSQVQRSLAIVEMLAEQAGGASVGTIAARLAIPPSATHRLLSELARLGWVRQAQAQGDYALTMRLPALGLGLLHRLGIGDVAQPILDELASDSAELVRLSVAESDDGDLVWLAVAQGATSGLRYDPGREQGAVAHLAHSASGRAWLSALPEDLALARVVAQGLTPPEGSALTAAPALTQVAADLARDRAQGYAIAIDSYLAGMAAIAVPVMQGGRALGALSIAGPSVRLTQARMLALLPMLRQAAARLGACADASGFFRAGFSRAARP